MKIEKMIASKDSITWILGKVKKRLPVIGLLIGVSILNAYLGVLFALSTKGVIDSTVNGEYNSLAYAALKLGLIIFGQIAGNVVYRHLYDKLEADLDRDLKSQFMHIILQGEYADVAAYHSGDLVYRLNGDIRIVVSAIMSVFPGLASLLMQTIAVVVVLSGISYYFTALLILLCVVVAGGGLLFRGLLKQLNKDINQASGKISGFFQETIEKLLIVQALDVAPQMEQKSENLLETRWQFQRKRKNVGIATYTGLSFLGYLVSFITLVWCAYRMMHGQMTFGELTATTQLADRLEAPVYYLPGLIRQLLNMGSSADRLKELEGIRPADTDRSIDAVAEYAVMDAIMAERLTFGYGRDTVLNQVNFTIPKGSLTVIVGHSGIGKSTLLKLLLGIYTPESGGIYLKGRGHRTPVAQRTRGMFSYAPQGNLLLSGTLRENLTFASPKATEEEIWQAIYVSGMDEYIAQLPDGLETQLGENAAGLSEGQAQRLSLARAILSRAPILLLDEVTSALDGETEKVVLSRIRELKNRTCIAVTHRMAVLDLADWQVKITKNGVESGPVKRG